MHDEAYGEPATGLELVTAVVQVGFVVSDEGVSPLTRPEYPATTFGTVPP